MIVAEVRETSHKPDEVCVTPSAIYVANLLCPTHTVTHTTFLPSYALPLHYHSLCHSSIPLCLSLPLSSLPLSLFPSLVPSPPFLSLLSSPLSLPPSLSFSQVYGIIERLSPGTLKIELFGRMHNCQPNWLTVGNQLQGVHLVEEDRAESFFARYPNGEQDLFSRKLPQPPALLPPR